MSWPVKQQHQGPTRFQMEAIKASKAFSALQLSSKRHLPIRSETKIDWQHCEAIGVEEALKDKSVNGHCLW